MSSKLTTLTQQKSAADLQTMSREALKWLTAKISELRNPGRIPATISRERMRYVTRFLKGGMYFFYYNPKLKDELPYYDKFPLVLILERYDDGFLGLNLHYLPIKYRVAFMNKLIGFGAIYNEQDELKRIRITYDILNASRRFREFRPCIKRYLNTHIQSKILAVQPNEWDVALFLPVHQFKKAPAKLVWQESVEQIRNS